MPISFCEPKGREAHKSNTVNVSEATEVRAGTEEQEILKWRPLLQLSTRTTTPIWKKPMFMRYSWLTRIAWRTTSQPWLQKCDKEGPAAKSHRVQCRLNFKELISFKSSHMSRETTLGTRMPKQRNTSATRWRSGKNIILCPLWRRPQHAMLHGQGGLTTLHTFLDWTKNLEKGDGCSQQSGV